MFCIGVIFTLTWVESFIVDIRAFMEFRTDIMKKVNFTGFDNVSGIPDREIIPNYIHYIRLEQPEIRSVRKSEILTSYTIHLEKHINVLRFFEAVCMKSAFMIQKPEKIYIHTDTPKLRGKYWEELLRIPGFSNCLVIKQVTAPKQIFGVEFYWNAHKVRKPRLRQPGHQNKSRGKLQADVLRLLVLRRYGGMYLDNDIFVINSLDKYRR